MKKLDLFILKTYLGPLVMTFFIALFILLMQFVWKYIDDLVGKGLEWYVIFQLLFYASSTFVPMALPLAILLSSLMTFGNLGEHYELVSMKSAGVSLRRIMAPLVVVSIMISGLAFYFANTVLPLANLKFLSLLYDVREKKLAFNLREGVFYDGIEGFVIRVGKKEADGSTIRDVMIYDHRERHGNTSVTVAEWGKMELSADKQFLIFRLYNGTNYEERTDMQNSELTRPFQRTRFKEQFQTFDLSDLQLTRTDENLFKKNYEMQNIRQLVKSIDSLQADFKKEKTGYARTMTNKYPLYAESEHDEGPADLTKVPPVSNSLLLNFDRKEWSNILNNAQRSADGTKESIGFSTMVLQTKDKVLHKHEIVLQKKFTFSIACFLLFFIGAPLGAIIRKGGLGMPAVVAALFFILYYIISFIGEKYALVGAVPVWQGMWVASAILLPMGIFLVYKANADASLLDIDSWIRVLQKILRIPTEPRS
jgi:lipopolysaccharide export system permease protein